MKLGLIVLVGAVVADLLTELNKQRHLRGIRPIKYSNTLRKAAHDYFYNRERFKTETASAVFGSGICLLLDRLNCNVGTAEAYFLKAGVKIVEIKDMTHVSKTLSEYISTPRGLCLAFSTWFYGCRPWLSGAAVTNGDVHILVLSPYAEPGLSATDQDGLRPVGFNPPSCKLIGMEEYEVPGNNAVFIRAYYSINAERVLQGLNPFKYANIILPSSPPFPCPFAPQDTTCKGYRHDQTFYYTKVANLDDRIENLIMDFFNALSHNTILFNSDPKVYFKKNGKSLQILHSYRDLYGPNTYRNY